MSKFDPRLLSSREKHLSPQTTFRATLEAHGVYDAKRFVVRLSPVVHAQLSSLPDGVEFATGMNREQVQAYSTYLHETVHWWQHIGSTCGFMLSLSFPAQTHANIPRLKEFLTRVGPVKSVYEYVARGSGSGGNPTTSQGVANIIVNNRFDIQAYRFLATNPDRAAPLVNEPLFESIGHAYQIAMGQGLMALANTVDPDANVLPHPRNWEAGYSELREGRHEGFYFGSPITLSPIGAHHIFEGQARFVQLQYLHFGSGGRFDWDEAAEAGMLSPIYTTAFEIFLKQSGLTKPASIDHPTVGLFLVICDIAMNPGEGFPLPIWSYKTFLSDVDPGIRFVQLSAVVRLFCPEVATAIQSYSAEEYETVSAALCATLKTYTPLENCRAIGSWLEQGEGVRACLARHDIGTVGKGNVAIDLLFGQFLSYSRDKLRYPHILCWPGAAMAGKYLCEESAGVMSRQSALFIDRAEDEMIVPVIRSGLNEATVHETFQAFYGAQSLYDLTYQWIDRPGAFTYDYRWLQPNGSADQMRSWASEGFERLYGVSPDQFQLLSEG